MPCLCHFGFKLFESRNSRMALFFETYKHGSKNACCMLRKIWPAKKEDRLCTVFCFFVTHVNGQHVQYGTAFTMYKVRLRRCPR